MTDDLNARLRATSTAYEARESGAQPDELELARIYRDVRRRRNAHGARRVGVAAAAVIAVSATGWFGMRAAPDVPPAHTPAPTSTVPTTPAPTTPAPGPTPGPTAPERTPVEQAGMPAMWSLDDDVLAAAGTGWTLTTYGPHDQINSSAPHQVVLASPDGELFHVVTLPPDLILDVVAWDGGRTAVVDGPDGRASFDLRTGALTGDTSGLPDGASAHGWNRAGELWLTTDGAMWLVPPSGAARAVPGTTGLSGITLSPDGARGAATLDDRPVVVDLSTGAVTDVGVDGLRCSGLGWADVSTVALMCTDPTDVDTGGFFPYLLADPDSRPRYVLAPADGSGPREVREIRRGELVPGRVLPVRPGTVAVSGAPLGDDVIECSTATELREGDAVTPLVGSGDPSMPGTTATHVYGDVVHVLRFAGCSPDSDAGPSELVVVDTASRAVTVLPAGPSGEGAMVPRGGVTVAR